MTLILAAEAERTALLLTAIDAKLADISGVSLVSAAAMQDWLLDLRTALTRP